MKKIPTWAAAVALAAAVTTTTSAFGQADLQFKQAREREAQQKKEQREGNKQEQQADRQERRQLKREREQLSNMPNPVKRVLRAETEGATNIDYFKTKEEGKERPTFGATFTKADGRNYDLRIDREGNVLSRTDLTARQAAAQAPATPAPVAPAPAPVPGPAPTPPPVAQSPAAPAPKPTAPTASAEAPESGDPVYRDLQASEVPAKIRTVLDREAKGGTDVKYYRSKYGKQLSYTVRFDDANGREQGVHVADNGEVLARGGKPLNEDDAQAASGSEKADPAIAKSSRIELSDAPRQVQTQLRRLTEGASDVKVYRSKYGNQQAYQASYTGKDKKDHRVFVSDDGQILAQDGKPVSR